MQANNIEKETKLLMQKAIQSFEASLSKLRTGRANTSLIEHLKVVAYGSEVPLNQVASITVQDARTLTITPWDKSMVEPIEKAIMSSDMGLQPNTAGLVIRLVLPPLTMERRQHFVKVLKQMAEQARVSVRHARRDANGYLKNWVKEKSMSEDEERRIQGLVQEVTDQFIKKIDSISLEKEKELMHV